jgi:hypothetical protein
MFCGTKITTCSSRFVLESRYQEFWPTLCPIGSLKLSPPPVPRFVSERRRRGRRTVRSIGFGLRSRWDRVFVRDLFLPFHRLSFPGIAQRILSQLLLISRPYDIIDNRHAHSLQSSRISLRYFGPNSRARSSPITEADHRRKSQKALSRISPCVESNS